MNVRVYDCNEKFKEIITDVYSVKISPAAPNRMIIESPDYTRGPPDDPPYKITEIDLSEYIVLVKS